MRRRVLPWTTLVGSAAAVLGACASPDLSGRWTNDIQILDAKPGEIAVDLGRDGSGMIALDPGLRFFGGGGREGERQPVEYRVRGDRLVVNLVRPQSPREFCTVPFRRDGECLELLDPRDGSMRMRWRRQTGTDRVAALGK